MSKDPPSHLTRLLAIMARLRDPKTGCEWDQEQTFASIAPYTIEEAYEVADAIDRNDIQALKGELGDLLLQVVFHARMAEEAGFFDFDDVAAAISAKLEKRHPHIFGSDEPPEEPQTERWERIKAAERMADGASSGLDGIARSLPALMRAEKLQKRAARQGFDWPDTAGPIAKLQEELAELAAAQSDEERTMEAGDVLFAAVNIVRSLGVAPEEALRAANAKFERRFRQMEEMAAADGNILAELPLDRQEDYWQAAKRSEG
jgi:ATP diphosphatase